MAARAVRTSGPQVQSVTRSIPTRLDVHQREGVQPSLQIEGELVVEAIWLPSAGEKWNRDCLPKPKEVEWCVWSGEVWCGVVWYGVVRCYVVRCGVVPRGVSVREFMLG